LSIQLEEQRARVARVEAAEAIAALLDVEERPGVAVDHHRVAEELRVPDRRDVARVAVAGLLRDEGNLQVAFETPSKNARSPGRTAIRRR
jgi:hypothetical protein